MREPIQISLDDFRHMLGFSMIKAITSGLDLSVILADLKSWHTTVEDLRENGLLNIIEAAKNVH